MVWYGGRSRCVVPVWYYGGGIVWYGMVVWYHHCGTKFAFFGMVGVGRGPFSYDEQTVAEDGGSYQQ